jgi:alpha-glucosidase
VGISGHLPGVPALVRGQRRRRCGDLAGLTVRLPYIAALGVDGIWMTPFQPSPQVDQGYDVSDYCGVDPLFGTMEQFDSFLAQAHALGLRVLLDVIPHH